MIRHIVNRLTDDESTQEFLHAFFWSFIAVISLGILVVFVPAIGIILLLGAVAAGFSAMVAMLWLAVNGRI